MTITKEWTPRTRFFRKVNVYTDVPYAAHVLQWAAQGWLYECAVTYLCDPTSSPMRAPTKRMQRIAAGAPW